MHAPPPTEPRATGLIRDARGQMVRPFDPVRLLLFNQTRGIPPEKLQAMCDELLPGAREHRMIQIISVASGFFVVGLTIFLYFGVLSTWRSFDLAAGVSFALAAAVLLAAPLIGLRVARAKYNGQIVAVMLKYQYCPHCGYDIRKLTSDPKDGATVCPECGCAWQRESEPK